MSFVNRLGRFDEGEILGAICGSMSWRAHRSYGRGMTSDRSARVPGWVRVVVWIIAIGLAVLGVVVAIASSSFWPLIAFAGLALPMFPVGTFRASGSRSA